MKGVGSDELAAIAKQLLLLLRGWLLGRVFGFGLQVRLLLALSARLDLGQNEPKL